MIKLSNCILFLFLFMFSADIFAEGQPEATANDPISLGVFLPLTGNAADEGDTARQGFELAAKEIEKKGALKIKLVYEDSMGDTKTAVSAYHSMMQRETPPVIFTWGSGVGLALLPLVERDGVIQMGFATSTPKYRGIGDLSFRLFPSATEEAKASALMLLKSLKVNRIAIITVNNDYGIGLGRALKSEFEALGGKVLAEETFEANETTLKPQLLRLKKENPQYIYMACYPGAGALLLRQARELGFPMRFIASSATIGSKNFLSLAANAAEGLILAVPGPNFQTSKDPAVLQFVHLLRETYNEEAGPFNVMTARAYDALNLVVDILGKCPNKDSACLSAEILTTKDYPGATGKINFDEAGDSRTDFNFQVVKSGKFVAL